MESLRSSFLVCSFLGPLGDGLPPGVAARFEGGEVSFAELHEYLTAKYRKREEGRSALQHLRQRILVEREAERRRLAIPDGKVAEELRELRQRFEAAGPVPAGFEEELRRRQLSFAEFAGLLRISLLHEELARQDFGLAAGESPSSEQMNLWLSEREKKAEVVEDPARLPHGAVASVDGREISNDLVGATLRTLIGPKATRTALVDLIGARLVHKRGAELGLEAAEADLDAEIARRRERVSADERFAGVGYEALLQTQGQTVEELRADPKFRAGVLLAKIAERIYTAEALEGIYRKDAGRYEGLYGESRKVSWILIRGAGSPNALIKRSFEEAEKEIRTIRDQIRGPEDFPKAAKIYSEDERTNSSGGEVGFLHRREPDFEPAMLDAVFAAKTREIVGPLRIPQGAALLLVGETQPAPAHGEILSRIRDEMRADLYGEGLRTAKIVTFLD